MSDNPQRSSQRGFSLIELLIVVAIIGIIAAIVITYLPQAQQAARSASAVNTLRVIHSSQSSYRASAGRFGDLAALGDAGLIGDENIVAGEKSFYAINVTLGDDPAMAYTATATPVISSDTYRHFFLNESGIIRVEKGAAAGATSPPVE